MTLDLAPGTKIAVDGYPYTVEDYVTFHDVDFRLDLLRLTGATPAHERWLLAVLPESYLMLLDKFTQEWLATPTTTIMHEGEIFTVIYRGSGYRLYYGHSGRSKEGRVDYALFRANSGRVILSISRNDESDTWIGSTLLTDAVLFPGKTPAG